MQTSHKRVRYWCEDETRLGLKTIERRRITAKGVKPIGKVQWQREAFYLYGVVEPGSGEQLFWEFSHLDHACFECFLKLVSQAFPDSMNLIQVDNSTAHTAKGLHVPENIVLVFQPPHSPEVNPIERVWQHLKRDLAWGLFENLDALRLKAANLLEQLTPEVVTSLTGWDFILEALNVAGI